MVKTEDWATYDLVKYLASIESSLTFEEMGRLRRTSAFSMEGAEKEQLATGPILESIRYKAEGLYEPVDIFRELGLPVIDWGADNQWKPTSNNGKFL